MMKFNVMKYFKLIVLICLISCQQLSNPDQISNLSKVPKWSRNVVWYQIFPERFRNGDSSNDPRPEDMRMTYPEVIPEGWKISDWASDWYKEDVWMDELEGMDFNSKAQLRRYGGDLQGVLDKIDYLEQLGITGIYFNPLNDAPSLHKYDPRNWRHIDRNFGPNPEGDVAVMEQETANDPTTWQWTEADKLFMKVIDEFHKRDIRVIMDFSWNHTGYDFWAVNDIRQKGEESEFVDWYEVEQFDDANTEEDETKIAGWWGFKYLPLIKENVVNEKEQLPHKGNVASESFKQHVYNVSRRWLDPNGDGNFEDGVDGFRIDVATEMTLGWWVEYTQFVREVNSEALLLAEAWWFDWPNLKGPEKMITEGKFDALMNYRWFVLSSGLFKQNNPKLKPSEFVTWYDSLIKELPLENQQAMMNIVATHDTPRLSTSLFNENRFDQGSKLVENPDYKVHRPDEATWKLLKMYLLHQYSFVGSPHVWNGDELGMWGANDPDERKPIWWEGIEFEPEASQAYGKRTTPPDSVTMDMELHEYYKKVIKMRVDNPVLALGSLKYILQDDKRMLFGYSRKLEGKEVIAVFNLGDVEQEIEIDAIYETYENGIVDEEFKKIGGKLRISLPPKSGKVLLSI